MPEHSEESFTGNSFSTDDPVAADSPAEPGPESPKVMSGAAHLAFFTVVQLLVYFDRSVLSGLVGAAEAEFNLNGIWSGMLGSGFMVGFIIASPLAALMTGARAAHIMGIGLSIWCVAALVVSMTGTYQWLLIARMAAGAGEAAYVSLAPPLIDDTAPATYKALYLSIYFSAIFVGMALGFVAQAPFKTWGEARAIFFWEAVFMLPLVVFIMKRGHWFYNPAQVKEGREGRASSSGLEMQTESSSQPQEASSDGGSAPAPRPRRSSLTERFSMWYLYLRSLIEWGRSSCQQISLVLQSRSYCLLCLGYSASIFSLGGFAFWVPQFVEQDLHIEKSQAGVALGIMTSISGLTGTVAGGLLLDHMTVQEELAVRGRAAVRVAYKCSMLALPFVLMAVATRDASFFFACLTLGQFFVFMSTAPVNVAMMSASPVELRGLAMGICTTTTHVLGDMISPVFMGQVKVWFNGDLSVGMWILSLWPVWSVLLWGIAAGDINREKPLTTVFKGGLLAP